MCRPCYEAKRNAEHPARVERNREAARSRYQRNPPEARRKIIVGRYGLSPEAFDALLKSQDGRCAICLVDITGVSAKGYAKAHVDHCHDTGRVRGLLCAPCNTSIGKLGDSAERLARALRYLQRETTNE